MPEPTLSDVHVDSALTDFSVAIYQDASRFIAPQVFPVVNVPQQSGKYHTYDTKELQRTFAALRAPNTEAPARTFKMSKDSYHCEVYSIAVDVSEQVRANADPAIDPEEDAALVAITDMRIQMDKKWTEQCFTTGIWATEATDTWNTDTGLYVSAITAGIKTVLAASGKRPNTFVIGAESWYDGLWNSTALIKRLPEGAPKIITTEFIRNLFGFDRVFLLDTLNTTGAEGTTAAPSFIHTDHALICYVDPNAGVRQATAGKTFVWSGLVGAGNGIRTLRMDMQWKDALPRVQVDAAYDFKVVSTDLGYLIKHTVS